MFSRSDTMHTVGDTYQKLLDKFTVPPWHNLSGPQKGRTSPYPLGSRASGRTVDIFIKLLSGKTLKFNVDENTSIYWLKHLIEESEG
jgi:hypothetical protein